MAAESNQTLAGPTRMHVNTELEYTYVPPDLFEATTTFTAQVGTISFDTGRAVVTLPGPMNPVGKTDLESATTVVRRALERALGSRAMAICMS